MGDKKELILKAVTDGQVIPVTEVKDVVFSDKMIGDGYGMIPSSGAIYSPVSGQISQLAGSHHAYYINLADDNKILIHVGPDAILLNGQGLTSQVKQGDEVQAGDLLGTIDLDYLKSKRPDLAISVVFLFNKDLDLKVEVYPQDQAQAKQSQACKISYQELDNR